MISKSSVFFIKISIGIYLRKHVAQITGTMCACFVLCFFAPTAFCQDTGKITLAAFNYPPFFLQESNEIKGIGVDLANELFRRIHLEIELTMYPLKRALLYINNGMVDGIMIIIKTPEREKYLIYSEPVVPGSGYIWSAADRKGGPVNFERLEDLKPYKTGVTVGYSYGEAMDELLKSMDTDSAPKEYYSFKKLMLHRIDIIPATAIVAKSMIKSHPEFHGKFIHSTKAFLNSNYYMGIGKKSRLAQMIPLINQTIADMKSEGFIDQVIKKYTE